MDLGEPTVERGPQNSFRVSFLEGTRTIAVRLKDEVQQLSLRDLYRCHLRNVRRHITWSQLVTLSECEDPEGPGWVDFPVALAILKRMKTYKMFKAIFKLNINREILQIEAGEVVEEEEEEVEEAAEEIQRVKKEDDDFGSLIQDANVEWYRKYYGPEPSVVTLAIDTMAQLETEFAEDLPYHLWWSFLMREEAYRLNPKTPRKGLGLGIYPYPRFGSWPRPYGEIKQDRLDYVEEDEPLNVASMMEAPQVVPPFRFFSQLFTGYMYMSTRATLIDTLNPNMDIVKVQQLGGLQSKVLDREVEDEGDQEEYPDSDEEEEDTDLFYNVPQGMEDWSEFDVQAVMDLVDPVPDDYVKPEPFREKPKDTITLENSIDPTLPQHEGVANLMTGLNTAYQHAIYKRIDARRAKGEKIVAKTETNPIMPTQCVAQIQRMIDEMLTKAYIPKSMVSSSRKMRGEKMGYKRFIQDKNLGIGKTSERLKELFGSVRVAQRNPDTDKPLYMEEDEDVLDESDEEPEEQGLTQLQMAIKLSKTNVEE